jgi:hypothetical protein
MGGSHFDKYYQVTKIVPMKHLDILLVEKCCPMNP